MVQIRQYLGSEEGHVFGCTECGEVGTLPPGQFHSCGSKANTPEAVSISIGDLQTLTPERDITIPVRSKS